MNEMTFNALTEIFKIQDEIAKEKKEACIHCGKIWYVIHHEDGVCYKCQRLHKPGKSTLEKRT